MSYVLILFYLIIPILQILLHKYKGTKITNGLILFLTLIFYIVFFITIFEINAPEVISDAKGRAIRPRNCLVPRPIVAIIFSIPGWIVSISTYIVWLIYTKRKEA